MQKKTTRLQPAEHKYIRDNCFSKTDEEIAKNLGRSKLTITKIRKKFGIHKGQNGRILEVDKKKAEQSGRLNELMSEEQRIQFFKTQFVNSAYYDAIKNQFTDEEIQFYLEEWGSLCVQFEDIIATETRQVDEYIKTAIMGNRIGTYLKHIQLEIMKRTEETTLLYSRKDLSDEDMRERDEEVRILVQHMSEISRQLASDLHKNTELKEKLLENLHSRRKDRTDHLRKSANSWQAVIVAMEDREIRKVQGNYMELLRLAKEREKKRFRKEITFPDGSKDCILLDDQSEIAETEIVMMEDSPSRLVTKYKNTTGKSIFIVENDIKRVQVFQELFKNNNLEYASDYYKAVGTIPNKKFDLICMDYDLTLSKGVNVAEIIKNNNLDCEVLIHSMNKEGAEAIRQILMDSNTIEVFPFDQILKTEQKQLNEQEEGNENE